MRLSRIVFFSMALVFSNIVLAEVSKPISNDIAYSAISSAESPFSSQALLPEIADNELTNLNWQNLEKVEQSEIEDIVKNMRGHAHNDAHAIGLHSGMVLYKNDEWQSKVIKNREGANAIWQITENNITWYPDYLHTQGIRFTSGKFNMGKMPLNGRAVLDIPLKNIKKDNAGKIWFYAKRYEENGAIVSDLINKDDLSQSKNYYQVYFLGFIPMMKTPILEFFGYYDTYTGEWKIKFVIDSKQIVSDEDMNAIGQSGKIHPKLNLKVFSQGMALQ